MFGPALMACPVTTAGATNRNVYLPAGATWYDFWTGATNAGGQTVSAAATIDKLPLYVRAGSIIPYGPAIQYAMQTNDPIELRVYRGASGSFTLYEDEGDNYDYESGSYATIPFTWDESSQTLTIGARQGSFPGMLTNRTFRVVWVSSGHGIGIPTTTTADAVVTYTGAAQNIGGP
jgi:alpha-D-xyloside xylohydrolase